MRPINLEKLHEATDEQLREAYDVAIARAHDAPKSDQGNESSAWSRFSREAFRLMAEIDRRKPVP